MILNEIGMTYDIELWGNTPGGPEIRKQILSVFESHKEYLL
jgi:hypothetical protein